MLIKDVLAVLWEMAPERYREAWDNVGLLCGRGDREVRRVLVALDPTEAVAAEAARRDCQLVLTHHPLIHGGLKAAVDSDPMGAKVLAFLERGLAVISMHTNLDCAPGGVNDVLAARLGLRGVTVLDDGETAGLVRIGRLAEHPNTDSLTDADSSVAALPQNDTIGEGMRPAANPNTDASVDIDSSVAALPQNDTIGEGMRPEAFAARVKTLLGCAGLRWADGGRPIRTVAVGGGSCADFAPKVLAAGCDALVTADVKYHQFCDAAQQGLTLIDAGHFQTENPVCDRMIDFLRERSPELEVLRSETHADCIRFL